MFKLDNCELVEVKECDILYQVKYKRKCDGCGHKEFDEKQFMSVLKCGHTMDIDNWHCPNCGRLCETKINYSIDTHNSLGI